MSTLYGTVEFRQLDEWYALIDAGLLILKNSELNQLCFGAHGEPHSASRIARRGVPTALSVRFAAEYLPIHPGVFAETWATLAELETQVASWQRDQSLAELLAETNFLVLLELMQVLGRRFGKTNVRVVLYFD